MHGSYDPQHIIRIFIICYPSNYHTSTLNIPISFHLLCNQHSQQNLHCRVKPRILGIADQILLASHCHPHITFSQCSTAALSKGQLLEYAMLSHASRSVLMV